MTEISNSVIEIKKARGVKENTKVLLFALSAGRCEICNELLIKDKLTNQTIVWGEMAHIYAFSRGGPRSDDKNLYKNDVTNLLLACPNCHEKIDKHTQEKFYTVEYLKTIKAEHEERIRLVTTPNKNGASKVLCMVANINNEESRMSMSDVSSALIKEKLYCCDENAEEIDFTCAPGLNNSSYWKSKKDDIDQVVERFKADLIRKKIKHISIFAIGPMPLLMHLGTQLDNKIETSFFQRHRDGEDWGWRSKKAKAKYDFKMVKKGKDKSKVALLLSLSGLIDRSLMPDKINKEYYIYELLVNPNPNYNFLRSEKDLHNFIIKYGNAISFIKNKHKGIKHISIFPAVPAPVAVICGRALNKNSDPRLKIYNSVKKESFKYTLTIN